MKKDSILFQERAIDNLCDEVHYAMDEYKNRRMPQVISYTAPTGAGKTIIMASVIEEIFFGNSKYEEQPDAIFVWLSDNPELNEQSKQKIDLKADRIRLDQTITIEESSFNQEYLDEGHIYFLNTQKLSKGSLLTTNSDTRHWTIWETLNNTVREKSEKLYFIIDEAHRGMQDNNAATATSIMQKFLKGSPSDSLPKMPLVIGISATSARFDALVAGLTNTIVRKVITTTDEVRASGLLKERIVIPYPDINNNDMAILQAASDEWLNKWNHWYQYCVEQHYAYINPIFVIQVKNSNSQHPISETPLDECIKIIEERTGQKFKNGEVVHTFGTQTPKIQINGLNIQYVEPSKISDDKNIKIVFFKENLSTGWDCPRAETMISFRHANDSTYIAQLLGRMIRTPMKMHIQVDDSLNDVHLFLPYFNEKTVDNVVKAIRDNEGADLPSDIYTEQMGENKIIETLGIKPDISDSLHNKQNSNTETSINIVIDPNIGHVQQIKNQIKDSSVNHNSDTNNDFCLQYTEDSKKNNIASKNEVFDDGLNRGQIINQFNRAGLLTNEIRTVVISNYLKSLFKLVHLITRTGTDTDVLNTIKREITEMINNYIQQIKTNGNYENLINQTLQFKLKEKVFDVFGETIDNNKTHDLFTSTELDIEKRFRLAESKLENEGLGYAYINTYGNDDEINLFKIHFILFSNDSDSYNKLTEYAKNKFHAMNDVYRHKVFTFSDKDRNEWNKIVSNGDIVSALPYHVGENISFLLPPAGKGKEYEKHLFVNKQGKFYADLNTWEDGVLNEEFNRPDFLCWFRNQERRSWALKIAYDMDNKKHSSFPDFFIIRKDSDNGILIDILEPHDSSKNDNLPKAKAFSEYASLCSNTLLGRIELIREGKDGAGKKCFKRLDFCKSLIREKIQKIQTEEELTHLFDTDGYSY